MTRLRTARVLLAILIVMALATLAVYGIGRLLHGISSPIPNKSMTQLPLENHGNPSDQGSGDIAREAIALIPASLGDITDTGYIALVNREHAVLSKPSACQLSAAWPGVPVSFIDGMYLHPTALSAVMAMFDSARGAGISGLFVSSGFRDYYAQGALYNSGTDRNYVLPPGHSEHHTGLAVDIMAAGVAMRELGNSEQGRWLNENSYRYGLILRYPQNSQHLTGIAYEPWHFRYIGRAHAYFMRQNGLVLEQYIEMIHEQGQISFVKNGITYYVLHQFPENGMINVPKYLDFIVSADNLGGFIIKAW